MSFGEWVRKQRGKQVMAECARRGGMKPPQWARLEKEGKHPRRETIEKVALGLQVPLDTVLEAAGFGETETEEGDQAGINFGRRLHRILMELPAEERARIETQLERNAYDYVALLRPYLEMNEV
jgi:transcriptional regulator with XRE-family HTH domain